MILLRVEGGFGLLLLDIWTDGMVGTGGGATGGPLMGGLGDPGDAGALD